MSGVFGEGALQGQLCRGRYTFTPQGPKLTRKTTPCRRSRGGQALSTEGWFGLRPKAAASTQRVTRTSSKARHSPAMSDLLRTHVAHTRSLLAGETKERYDAFLSLWERVELEDLTG